jgi:SAM-dependent methyltransferase
MTFSNSKIFNGRHSGLYDLLYKSKSHSKMAGEISTLMPRPLAEKRILEIGCGTGSFTTEISLQFRKSIIAVDSSFDMLKIASEKNYETDIEFIHTDVLHFSHAETFSLISLLFHVVSYLTTEEEVEALISVFKKNTSLNDYVVFDFWNCACVHVNNPVKTSTMVKIQENCTLIRSVAPEMSQIPHIWPLNIKLKTVDDSNATIEEINERHSMRCFSTEFWVNSLSPEFTLLCEWDLDTSREYTGDKYGSLLIFERTTD